MNLFIKGFLIGIAKIIPGVSGAMMAVSFNIYDKLINCITHFFDDSKNNLKFLLVFGSGVLLSIVCCSNLVRYFLNNYYLMTMMLFIGFIIGGTFNFSKNVENNKKNVIIVLLVVILVTSISLFNINNNYIVKGILLDYLIFFIGGVVEIFSSIVPGISGTALFMLMGIYDNILMLFGNVININFVFDNIMFYISYGLGMGISFIVFSLLISYLLKKYRNIFDTIVLGLCISSILLLLIMTFKSSFLFFDLLVGIVLCFLGIFISYFSI